MSDWTLLHTRSPLNTTGAGTGQFGELTKASGRKLTFSTEEADTLSFDMPGNHPQTAAITPLVDDVLVFRGDEPVQRFRVVTRAMSKDSAGLKVSFTAVSYREVLYARFFQAGDTLAWPTATEQSAIAWKIVSEAQAKLVGQLGILRGVIPANAVNRILTGNSDDDRPRPNYFLTGMKLGEAITQISQLANGFDWAVEPDPADPYRRLRFNTWNAGTRSQYATRSPLVLDDGGSMMTWSHTVTPTDYGNVVRFTGAETTDENGTTKAVPITPAWFPTSRDPVLPAPEGRWERDINNSDLTTQAAVDAAAGPAYDAAHLYVPEITCTLRRGKWLGPRQLWLGDKARLIITEPVDGKPDDYLLYVDEDVRIVQLDVDVDEQGGEDITLALNRRTFSSRRNTRTVNDRLNRLERR